MNDRLAMMIDRIDECIERVFWQINLTRAKVLIKLTGATYKAFNKLLDASNNVMDGLGEK